MAKVSGITSSITVDDSGGVGRDISDNVTNLSFATPRGSQDVTGLDVSAMERLLLLADGNVTINGVFDAATNMSHDVFKTVATSNATRTVVIVTGGATLTMEMIFTDYSLSRGNDGSLTWTATGSLANGTAPAWS